MSTRKKTATTVYTLGLLSLVIGTLLSGYNVVHTLRLQSEYKEKTETAMKSWNRDHVVLTLQMEKKLFETCKWNDGKVFVVFDGKTLKN